MLRGLFRAPSSLAWTLLLAAALGFWIGRGSGKAARIAELEHSLDVVMQGREDVMRLSSRKSLETLLRRLDDLWPADERHIPALTEWLEEASDLLGALPLLEESLERVRGRARPASEEEIRVQLQADPRVRELADLRERAAAVEAEIERAAREPGNAPMRARTIDGLSSELDVVRAQIGTLELVTDTLWTGTFNTLPERWFHGEVATLVDDLHAFQDPERGPIHGVSPVHGPGVIRRLELASTLRERSVSGAEARALWQEARASIADPARGPAYRGLELAPQLGLLPLGPDPRSGLWEFAHLPTGRAPVRDPDSGSLEIDAESGLVFVLLPGRPFLMGAQSLEPDGPNYDPQAAPDEAPVHELELGPFFISKFEMTQQQWERTNGRNPSDYRLRTGEPLPVEAIYWSDAFTTLWKLGLDLPTEAQWEYATRGGTASVWWTGDERESLAGAANLADAAAIAAGATWDTLGEWPEFHDGYVYSAAVHELRPNAFGLHHVAGNVFEWCRDWYGSYELPTNPGDCERIVSGRLIGEGRLYGGIPFPAEGRIEDRLLAGARAVRGGSFVNGPTWARSAARAHRPISIARGFLGLRPARIVER